MNVVSNDISRTDRAAIDEPSFADAMAAIAVSAELDPEKKKYWTTSLRQMSAYLGRPAEVIPARIAPIGPAISKLHPGQLGVNDKTFANHRANVRAALLWFNRLTLGSGRGSANAPEYQALLKKVDDRHVRDLLSPLFRFLTSRGISAEGVDDSQIEGFLTYRKESRFRRVTLGYHRHVVRSWNMCIGRVPGWPVKRLTEPPLAPRFRGPAWDDFPPRLRSDIEAYCASLAVRRKSASGRRLRPSAQSTIDTRRRELIAAVRAAIETGIPLDELHFLADLLRPDRVEAMIDSYWRSNGEIPTVYTIDLAAKFVAIGRSIGLDGEALERLDEIREELEEHRQIGLTEKNRALVRKIIQGDAWAGVVRLPQRLIAEARHDRQRSPARAAVKAELAVAIRLLVVAPVRMKNLASIRLDEHLVRPGGPGKNYLLVFADYEVKNRVPLEFPLDYATTALVEEYVHLHRPRLMCGRNSDYLFPGTVRAQKSAQDLGEQISRRLWKELGLAITPHQFRHAAAAIMLRNEPGNYEWVRRVLGHRNIQTTINYYIGLETLEATRRFGDIVTAMLPSAGPGDGPKQVP